jgi:hypothetical protein
MIAYQRALNIPLDNNNYNGNNLTVCDILTSISAFLDVNRLLAGHLGWFTILPATTTAMVR